MGYFKFESSKIIELAEIGQLDLKVNSGWPEQWVTTVGVWVVEAVGRGW